MALVGRPNVGKSTLFNRLAEQRLAVVDDTPGTTRDRIMAEIEWNGMLFDLVDTGGIETYQETTNNPTSSSNFIKEIKSQYETAISEADTIVLMTDVTTGITSSDIYVANLLIQNKNAFKDKKILLAVNKCDNQNRTMNANEFYQLGITNLHPIAALHGLGIGDLLDDITMHLPQKKANNSNATTSIAIVGRPNVGKSSLLNRLLGQDRVIVSSVSGTTRDAIDTKLTYHKSTITLIDTAGIRRRGKITPGVEKYSVIRTLKAIDRAEIV
ncbi:MAG TPA: ribosome biogenesis GTPase Der, partial [Chloroflexi bacterium]|nr:ribosome biogenesis GTPase Der [Chloroflexota bacterium]